MTRCEVLAERANKLSGESKKVLRYLLPSGFPYDAKTFLITDDRDGIYDLMLLQIFHLENLEAKK